MANTQLFNLARMTVSSTGTGTITLNAAVSGFLTFDLAGCSTAATGQQITYAINDTTQSEIATGTYFSSALHVTRGSSTVDLISTNGNSPIDMSNTAQVFITPSAKNLGLTGQIPGTTTNDSANSGNVGEYIETVVSSGAAANFTSGAAANITAVNLTPGDWDVWGNFAGVGLSTILSAVHVWISSQSAVVPAAAGGLGDVLLQTGFTSGNQYIPTGTRRFTTAVSTTVYLSAITISSAAVWGTIAARRRR